MMCSGSDDACSRASSKLSSTGSQPAAVLALSCCRARTRSLAHRLRKLSSSAAVRRQLSSSSAIRARASSRGSRAWVAAARKCRILAAVRLGIGDHPFDLPTTWLGTDLAGQPPEGDRERVAAGTQRLGLVILGPILAAGRRAAWTERPASGHRRAGSGSPGSGLRVRRRWRRTRPTAGAGVCGRSTRRWLPQWREAITLSVCRSNSTSRIDPFTRRWRGARRAGRVVAGEPNRARR